MISEATRQTIAELALGKKAGDIAKQLDIPARTVRRIAAQARAGKSISRRRPGPKPKYSEEAEAAMRSEISLLRSRGVPVSSVVIQGVAMLKAAELGDIPEAKAPSRSWVYHAVKRWKLSFRKVTRSTRAQEVPGRAQKLASFTSKFRELKQANNIPDELIVNVDQVGVALMPSPLYSYTSRGARQVAVLGYRDKREITLALGTACAGQLLPPQVIYAGSTPRCHPVKQFPPHWNITHTKTHWSNSSTVRLYVENVLKPYMSKTRTSLGDPERRGLVILDSFSAHLDTDVLKAIEELNCAVLHVPPGLTGEAQPNDLLFNGLFKRALQKAFTDWYFRVIQQQMDVVIDHRMKSIRDKHVSWMISAYNSMEKQPEVVRRSWAMAGLRDPVAS